MQLFLLEMRESSLHEGIHRNLDQFFANPIYSQKPQPMWRKPSTILVREAL